MTSRRRGRQRQRGREGETRRILKGDVESNSKGSESIEGKWNDEEQRMHVKTGGKEDEM